MTKFNRVYSHLAWWFFCLLAIPVATHSVAAAAAPVLTQITGTMYRADGTPANGQIIISWPGFTAADQSAVTAGSKFVTLGAEGQVDVGLFPTAGASPAGTLYKVVLKSKDGTTATEYWSVPSTPTAVVSAIRVNASAATAQTGMTQTALSAKLGRQGDTPVTMAGMRFASEFQGKSSSEKIDSAISDCKGAPCVIVVPSEMDLGMPTKMADNAKIIDFRSNDPSSHQKDIGIVSRWTTVGSGAQHVANLRLDTDAYRGGINNYNGTSGTKSQLASLWLTGRYRTIGERKDITQDMWCLGKGDCNGFFNTVRDWGGYSTAGDEGESGLRVSSEQGMGGTFPYGTVSAVNGNKVTAQWTYGYTLGEQRPVINTSRNVYSTGTLVSAPTTSPCTITGSGTGWSTLGTGSHSDLFLEIVPLSNANGVKYVVPITSISDDTHLVLEYTLSENGNVCIGAGLPSGAAYNIYHGGLAASLDDPVTGRDPTAVNLAVPASMFQVGDAVQQPLGYNLKTVGINVYVNQQIGPGQGYGQMLYNTGTTTLESGLRVRGNFINPIRIDNNSKMGSAIRVSSAGKFVELSDESSSSTDLFLLHRLGGAGLNYITYDRTNNDLKIGPFAVDFATGAISQGLNAPIPTLSRYWMQWTEATAGGMNINGPTGLTANLLEANVGGIRRFAVSANNADFVSGLTLRGYSGNYTPQTWGISSSTGQMWAAKFCYNSAQTVCDYAGTGVPAGSCTTGSTYRRTDGTAGATFYVCEASAWAAK